MKLRASTLEKLFLDVRTHGFTRVALVIPTVHLADPVKNAEEHAKHLDEVYAKGAAYALCPELGLTGYSLQDLFQDRTLLKKAEEALGWLLEQSVTRWHDMLISVSLPHVIQGALYNLAVTLHNGKLLGGAPKDYLPNYGEFEEKRWFKRAKVAKTLGIKAIKLCSQVVPLGIDLLYEAENDSAFVVHTSTCEEDWMTVSPADIATLNGATICANLSASNITIGKDEYREQLMVSASGNGNSVRMYCAAGFGESSTNVSWDGTGFVAERGQLLLKTERFKRGGTNAVVDVDLTSLQQARLKQETFHDNAEDFPREMRRIPFMARKGDDAGDEYQKLLRDIDPHPFVPKDPAKRDERCRETFMIQSTALERKLMSMPPQMRQVIIGVSGGQDSTHAIAVAAHAMDALGLPRTNIIGVTMPGFGTTDRTYQNACKLIAALGATFKEIDIKKISSRTFSDLGIKDTRKFLREIKKGIAANDNSLGTKMRRTFFENVQAWSRKHVLFSVSGLMGGMVLGTGDLSELLVGWCTMFGDHASHYGINAGVPKTLISFLIRWTADVIYAGEDAVKAVLYDILDTEISPELLPPDKKGKIAQKSQDSVGPYELVDFFGYYFVRWGFEPSRVAFMALHAFKGKYDIGTIKKWLKLFLQRFIGSQFKRSCMPDGPKVGIMAVSPRGDLRMPSDAQATIWVEAVEADVPDELPLAA